MEDLRRFRTAVFFFFLFSPTTTSARNDLNTTAKHPLNLSIVHRFSTTEEKTATRDSDATTFRAETQFTTTQGPKEEVVRLSSARTADIRFQPVEQTNRNNSDSFLVISNQLLLVGKNSQQCSTASCNDDSTRKTQVSDPPVKKLTTLNSTSNSTIAPATRCSPSGDPNSYGLSIRIVGTVTACLLFVVGMVGNICVIAVVARTRSLRRHPTNWYLASVAVADCILLCSAALPSILEYQATVGDWVMGGHVGCSAAVFFQYLGVNVSSLSITAFSLERYVAICHPIKARVLCTVSRAKRIVAVVWIFGFLYCAPWIFLTTTKPRCSFEADVVNKTNAFDINDFKSTRLEFSTTFMRNAINTSRSRKEQTGMFLLESPHRMSTTDFMPTTPRQPEAATSVECTFKLHRRQYVTYYMADLIIFYVFPVVATCILYAFIARTLRLSSRLRMERPSQRRMVSFEESTSEGRMKCENGTVSLMNLKGVQTSSSRIQVVKMLAVVVVVFAVLWLPYRMFVVYNSFAKHRFTSQWFLTFCRMAVYCNSAINPILYNLMSAKFRNAFCQLFLCSHFRRRLAHNRGGMRQVDQSKTTTVSAALSHST